jgi:hypothetical protein
MDNYLLGTTSWEITPRARADRSCSSRSYAVAQPAPVSRARSFVPLVSGTVRTLGEKASGPLGVQGLAHELFSCRG